MQLAAPSHHLINELPAHLRDLSKQSAGNEVGVTADR